MQVPGVSSDMYFFTLGVSVAGGLVVGFVNTLEPQGGPWGLAGYLTNILAVSLVPCQRRGKG